MKAVVAERGQVTITKALRDKLGIRQGTTLEFAASNGTLIARKAETDPVSPHLPGLAAALKKSDSDPSSDKSRLASTRKGAATKETHSCCSRGGIRRFQAGKRIVSSGP